MKRKVISLLAILAMLVSMLACFVIPLSAEETTTETTEESTSAYTTRQLVSELYSVINWSGNSALKGAVQEAYGLQTDDGNTQALRLIDAGLSGKDGDGNELAGGALTWETFDPTVKSKVYPRYLFHDAFTERDYKDPNWSISDPADWAAMRDVADVATEDYFPGVTFHLTKDIDFDNDQIKPMGINSKGAGFAGILDGHGYGFNTIYVYVGNTDVYDITKATGKDVVHAGLFLRLADCTIRDFGLNSGVIHQASSNTHGVTSSFGTVVEGSIPTFERVWSSAIVYARSYARASALVGVFDEYWVKVNLNGFVFDGAIVKDKSATYSGQTFYGIYGRSDNMFKADGNDFYNIITDFRACNGTVNAKSYAITSDTNAAYSRGGKAALLPFSSVAAFNAAEIKNVYGVKRESEGVKEGYILGGGSWGGSGSDSLLTDMSAAEAAYTINNKPTENPVYFKLNEKGQVRPIPGGKSEGQIVKVTLKGDREETFFFNDETALDLAEDLGKTDRQTFAVDGSAIDTLTLNGDVEINVTIECTHTYTYSPGTNEHTKTCEACGYKAVEACALTVDCAADAETADAMTHSGKCVCGAAMTQNCVFEYQKTEGDYQYVCADCARAVDAIAPTVVGDVDGTAGVTLIDAVQLLKKVVKNLTITNRNEDVDGNNTLNVIDVFKTVKIALKDKKTLAEIGAYQARVNNSNYYYYNKDDEKDDGVIDGYTLTMNGEVIDSDNDRYVLTEYIADIEEGNEITFGPVRLGQAVMGYFYKESDKVNDPLQPLQLINHTNVTVEHEFEQGMVMVSVRVPQGADVVCFKVNADEKERFYIRINNDFTVADYQCRANLKEATLKNPLEDQLFLTVGDSLCAAAKLVRDSQPDGNLKGWARRIYQQFGAKVINSAEGGSAISTIKFNKDGTTETDDEPLTSRQCIVNQLSEHTGIGREFEYILLEGAGNDAANGAAIGSMSPLYDPASFDMTTYAGGLEMMIYTAIKEHGDTAAIGYMSYYDMPKSEHEGMQRNHEYFAVGKQICEKWGIEYLDLNTILKTKNSKNEPIFNATDLNVHTHDYIHANDDGYDIMQTYINAFLPQMRPVSKAIYDKVQKYADYTVPTFDEYSWDGYVSAEE